MNILDILGPVMIGPSSSHTAGAVRIGNMAQRILGGIPEKAVIKFHGSFANTYKGHGSDKAIIGGLMGYTPDDENIRNSLEIAKKHGMDYSFESVSLANVHPNTIVLDIFSKDKGNLFLQAESIGGGNIVIRKIDDVEVNFNGQYDAIIVHHTDMPGIISLVSNLLMVDRINIAKMEVYRTRKGGEAIMIIETDGILNNSVASTLEALPNISKVKVVRALS